jgi:hypothetical protein
MPMINDEQKKISEFEAKKTEILESLGKETTFPSAAIYEIVSQLEFQLSPESLTKLIDTTIDHIMDDRDKSTHFHDKAELYQEISKISEELWVEPFATQVLEMIRFD